MKKDICSKIEFYKFTDVYYLNDPITYIPANKNSNEDIFTIVFYKSKSTDSELYNKIDMKIEGRDKITIIITILILVAHLTYM